MTDPSDRPGHRNVQGTDEPLDAASKSLADALRASFTVLKGIMVVLVVLYLFSNVRALGSHEQALILRFGRLLPRVHEAGLVWAFPYPIDEIVPLPTRKSNELLVKSHTFYRRENEIGKPISFITRAPNQGLNPAVDGALLTADAGLVHVQWKLTYKIEDVRSYVSRILGREVEAAETVLRNFVETIGVEVASKLTAEEMIRTRVDYVQREMQRRLDERLNALGSGITVTLCEMYEPTPPLQVRQAFDDTQKAENTKQRKIRAAEKERTRILNETAGPAYRRLVRTLEALDRAGDDDETQKALRAELDRILDDDVEGRAGKRIKQAGAYRARVVSEMQSDIERYRTLLPEYKRSPLVLINRLWEQTRQEIFENAGVTKFYRPPGLKEVRVKIPLDPEQTRLEEAARLREEKFDEDQLFRPPPRVVPVGPENE